MNNFKRDFVYSLILGEASAWFLIFVIKNPYVEEFRQLVFLGDLIWWLPAILPLVFLVGVLLGRVLAKFIGIVFQIVRFGEVGALNTVIDFGILNILIWMTGITGGLAIAPLNIASFFCATTNSYIWNRIWTFGKREKASGGEFLQFLVVSGVGLGLNTGIVVLGTGWLDPLAGLSGGAWANVMKVAATLVSMTWNFLGYKFIVFKK